MKKSLTMSVIAGALLMTSTGALFAASSGMKDTVAQEETQAIKSPKMTEGIPAAKAKVEEANAKEEFLAKMQAPDFAKEARMERMERLQRVLRAENKLHKEQVKAPKEIKKIMEAIHLTFKAAQSIKAGKNQEAAQALEQASKNFEAALKADPKLDLVPVAEQVQVLTFAGDSKIIQQALDTADKLIKEHATQDARAILMPLRDEIDFAMQFLPMKSYPLATKKAAEALKQNKPKEALQILAAGFGTIVTVVEIVPTPLLLANDLVLEASRLDKAKKEEAIKLLNAAKEQLKRAELLGYTQMHSAAYKELNAKIDALEKEIRGKNVVEKLYEELKAKFGKLLGETRADRHR